MASFQEHCADCVAALGEPFDTVHLWLDAFFPVYGFDHRPERHHDAAVAEIRRMWGEMAARAAEIHILKDYGYIPTKEQADLWKLFR